MQQGGVDPALVDDTSATQWGFRYGRGSPAPKPLGGTGNGIEYDQARGQVRKGGGGGVCGVRVCVRACAWVRACVYGEVTGMCTEHDTSRFKGRSKGR